MMEIPENTLESPKREQFGSRIRICPGVHGRRHWPWKRMEISLYGGPLLAALPSSWSTLSHCLSSVHLC